jgi:hypothetical protein
LADKKRFYLPKNLVDKFDGYTLWFNITEDEAYDTYRDIEESCKLRHLGTEDSLHIQAIKKLKLTIE